MYHMKLVENVVDWVVDHAVDKYLNSDLFGIVFVRDLK